MTRPLTISPASPSGRLTQRDRRAYKRVPLQLSGRFLFGEDQDHAMRTSNVSCDGALILSASRPSIGEQIICYFDDVGRVVANVVRHTQDGFAVRFQTSPHKRDKLADRLTWLLNRDKLGLEEERASERTPTNDEAIIQLSEDRQLRCTVTDISLTGAAFEAHGTPPFVGEQISVGNVRAEVVRVTGNTFAVRYIYGARKDTALRD